ncbi:acyl-CoA N-acyltransferase [Whalleya microplaca]|nr:acyl-CoA N-acyltransferase [Whalleya microplaca]
MTSLRVSVETTLPRTPLPPNSQRKPIRTKRLVIRPMQECDLQAFRSLRAQPEAMMGTKQGRPDHNTDESKSALSAFLPPNDVQSFLFGAFLASTGEFIGEGGVHTLESSICGWPEIGYKLKKEFWGQGYGTEFLNGVLGAWWSLPRSTVGLEVYPSSPTSDGVDGGEVVEHVFANTDVGNIPSQKLLAKLGFTQFIQWTEPDTQEHRLGQPVTLIGYQLPRKAGP